MLEIGRMDVRRVPPATTFPQIGADIVRKVKVEEFTAKYDGPALDDHTMDVTTLGPALLAFGEMNRAAYRALNPTDDRAPTVKVQAVGEGSFEIMLALDLTWIEQARHLFTRDNLDTAAMVTGLTGLNLLTVIGLAVRAVKSKLSGKRPTVDELADEIGDAVIANVVDKLQDDDQFIKGLKKATSPMLNEGVDSLLIGTGNREPIVSINKEEAEAIDDLAVDEEINVSVGDYIVRVISPHTEDAKKRKWRLESQESGLIMARLLDDEFADLVEKGQVSFSNSRRFKARLRVEERSSSSSNVVKRSYEIVSIRALPEQEGEQDEFDFTDD